MPAPKYMQDRSTAMAEKLEDVSLNDDPSVQKMISMSVFLIVEEKKELVSLLVKHQRRKKLRKQLLSLGHYRPTMRKDTHNMVKRYHACQVHGNLTHKPLKLLQDMHTPWLFRTWGLDLVRIMNLASEAIPIRKATGVAIPNFIRENKQVGITLNGCGIKHCRFMSYNLEDNGQAKATNKALLGILRDTVHNYSRGWSTHLPHVLWVWRNLESLKERKVEVARKTTLYHQQVTKAYNRTVKPCSFKEGDLILRTAKHISCFGLGFVKVFGRMDCVQLWLDVVYVR
ncbi:hypothetical protein DVH24_002271 [Malus domestica]|uniref:Uncharacterized protein n=1 Tax=Malus domestica TaxID=3750 RepID=A0A498IC89_MALDO|nr:hypothetical protein DVH24_002271 [Malus domestica]